MIRLYSTIAVLRFTAKDLAYLYRSLMLLLLLLWDSYHHSSSFCPSVSFCFIRFRNYPCSVGCCYSHFIRATISSNTVFTKLPSSIWYWKYFNSLLFAIRFGWWTQIKATEKTTTNPLRSVIMIRYREWFFNIVRTQNEALLEKRSEYSMCKQVFSSLFFFSILNLNRSQE